MEHVVSAAGIARIYAFVRMEHMRAEAAATSDSGAHRGTRKRRAAAADAADVAQATDAAAAAAAAAATAAAAAAAAAAVVEAEVQAAIDPSAVVAAHGTSGETGADAHCVAAMEAFLDVLGAEAANLALRFQAHGGVYLAGVRSLPARRPPPPHARVAPSHPHGVDLQVASPRSSPGASRLPTARPPRGYVRRTWARGAPSRPTARVRCMWSPSRATASRSRECGALRAAARAAASIV